MLEYTDNEEENNKGAIVLSSENNRNDCGPINIQESTDVVIGNVSEFHGPVTIYQTLDVQNLPHFINPKSIAEYVRIKESKEKSKGARCKWNEYSKTLVTVIFFMFTGITAIAVFISIHYAENEEESPAEPPLPSPENSIIIPKERWGGRPPLSTIAIKSPVSLVIIAHTASQFCRTFEACAQKLITIQSMHVSKNQPDIGYNFLIGGDGNVYVGRGWDVQNYHTLKSTILIGFIGNYIYEYLTPKMINATQTLLDIGLDLKKITPDYKLVAHNQTASTLSPGNHVVEVIRKLPHYDPQLFL